MSLKNLSSINDETKLTSFAETAQIFEELHVKKVQHLRKMSKLTLVKVKHE